MIKSAIKSEAKILAEVAIHMWNDNIVLDLEKELKNFPKGTKRFVEYLGYNY